MSVNKIWNRAIPVEKLSDGDMIVVHTAFLTSIIGIANWLKRIRLKTPERSNCISFSSMDVSGQSSDL